MPTDILHVGKAGLGLLKAALPIGSLVCALILAHLPPFARAGRALIIAVVVFGLATIGFGFSRSFWLSMLMLFVCGMADTISIVDPAHLGAIAHARRDAGPRFLSQQFIHRHLQRTGRVRVRLRQRNFAGRFFRWSSAGCATMVVVGAVCWLFPEIPRYGRLVQPAPAAGPDTPEEKLPL